MSKILTTSILLFFILFCVVFMVLPKYQDLKVLSAKVAEKQTELSSKEEYFAQIALLSEELGKHQEELSKIDLALPVGPNLPLLFKFLEKSCSESGLVLKRIGPFTTARLKKGTNVRETQIEFEVSGNFDAFMELLLSLEKSARLIEVSFASFDSPKEGDIFSFAMRVKVHSY